MIQTLAAAAGHIRFDDLGLSPVAIDLGFFDIKWYSITYILSILGGWWYLLKLLAQPGAPMARRHADDLVFYATLGIILGGRLGYILFYSPDIFLHPLRIFRLWEGGMSWHGGVIGTSIALILFARKNKLDWLRVHDYVAVVTPIGPLLVRIANFVNGELWGKPSDLPWAVVFPHTIAYGLDPARHPSQIYESLLEGGLMLAVMAYAFWRTRARYAPGKLVGIFILGYGLVRFFLEFFREPDAQLVQFAQSSGLHMGQWLCLPMIFGGIYLIASANSRRQRVEPIAGSESVA